MITMTADEWSELCHAIWMLGENAGILASEHPNVNQWSPSIAALRADLMLQVTTVNDANTRARYMALAAEDQLGLFDFDGAPI